jgi:hypothetical protein
VAPSIHSDILQRPTRYSRLIGQQLVALSDRKICVSFQSQIGRDKVFSSVFAAKLQTRKLEFPPEKKEREALHMVRLVS